MINGLSFCSFDCASDTPPTTEYITEVTVENGIFDVLHVADLEQVSPYTSLPDGWDLDTIMRADFNGDVGAGNVDYAFYLTSSLRIKRREVNSTEWITLMDIPVNDPSDFNFIVFDKLNRSNTDYEYAIIPVLNSVEGAIVSKEIHSEFDGVCIFDNGEMYSSVMDVAVGVSRIQLDGVVNTIVGKYPFYVKRSSANYHKGDCTAFFLPRNTVRCGFTTVGGLDYREALTDFLTNNEAKILKDGVGHIFIMQSEGDVQDAPIGHPDYVQSKFNWVELGNAKTGKDLAEFGFIERFGGA